MSIRPPAHPSTLSRSRPCKTGLGHMHPDDPALVILANAGKENGARPTARAFGVSDGLVRRALRIHGAKSPFVSTRLKHKLSAT